MGPQTSGYNHWNKIPVEEWKAAPTTDELEKQFGKFYFGFVKDPSVADTDTGVVAGEAPTQEVMEYCLYKAGQNSDPASK